MISGVVMLAFTAGMAATFNPRGFSLLPAYIGDLVAGGEIRQQLPWVTIAIGGLLTIGPFLAVTGAALSQSTIEGLATYIAYALRIGIIVLAINVASALAHSTVATRLASIVAATVLAIIALARLTGPGSALGDQAEPQSNPPPLLWTPPS